MGEKKLKNLLSETKLLRQMKPEKGKSREVLNRIRKLFITDKWIFEKRDVKRVLHTLRKYPANPIFQSARPWEGVWVGASTIYRDCEESIWKMWYTTGNRSATDYVNNTLVCYALSKDGIHWERPAIGLYDYWGFTGNNIILRTSIIPRTASIRLFGGAVLPPIKDSIYRMLVFIYNDQDKCSKSIPYASGYYKATSPDGIYWQLSPGPIFFFGDGVGDTASVRYDDARNQYTMFVKIFLDDNGKIVNAREIRKRIEKLQRTKNKKWMKDNLFRRHRGISFSKDFSNWTWPPETILEPDKNDPPDMQVYQNSGFICEDSYIGFLHAYHPDTTGTIDIQFIHSEDGVNWIRFFDRTPVLSPGVSEGNWDCGCVHTLHPPIRVGDELYIYYNAYWQLHTGGKIDHIRSGGQAGAAVGLAILRLDGFVSLEAGIKQGYLITQFFELIGSELFINANASGGGIRVEIQYQTGQPIKGLTKMDSIPVRRDKTRKRIQFKGERGVSALRNRKIRIKFYLKNAHLYSFWAE